ncbi:MAG: TonB-dependent receptor [Gemmatimonadales bacterium]
MRFVVRAILPVLFFTVGRLSAQSGQSALSGHVTDRNGEPVSGAVVSVVELNRAVSTDRSGSFRLGAMPSGRYTILVRRLGYAPAARTLDITDAPAVIDLKLEQTTQRIEPVNITAARTPTTPLASPLSTSVLTGDQVDREGGVSLAHSIARLPGVRSVSTGQQIGKPMIRGLFGPRVLVLSDGNRIEDYSWSDEDGPSIDARIAQRIEVIRGPASVLYGSEALSGVVNVVPADIPFSGAESSVRNSAIETYGASNNLEFGGAAMMQGARPRMGWRLMGTGRFSQNYKTPDGDVPNSSFWAFNGEGGLGILRDRSSTTFRAAHYGGEFHLLEATGPDPADPEGGPVRQVMDDRLQMTNELLARGVRFETKAQFQRHSLAEVSDDCVPPPGQTTCTAVKDQKTFGLVLNTATLDLLAHHAGGDALHGTVGLSGKYQTSSSEGPVFLVPSAKINSLAAFAFEQLALGRLTLVAGARGDRTSLSSDAQPEISRASDHRSWSATSGDAGVVFRPVSSLALVANYGLGWRAPTLFDLYANGPNIAEGRFELGDPTLATERARNIEGGIRWSTDRASADVTVYRNTVTNFIFTAPTQVFQNGLRVFRHEQTDARLTGGEASVEGRVTDILTLRAAHDFVQGDDRRAGEPLPLIPPARTIFGAELGLGTLGSFQRVSIEADVEIDQTQRWLSPDDFPTRGYSLLNLDLTAQQSVRGRPIRFDLIVRNALNTSYRDYMSRFKEFASAPGINAILRASAGAW